MFLLDRKSTRQNSSHTEIYTLSLHDALPIFSLGARSYDIYIGSGVSRKIASILKSTQSKRAYVFARSEEHTSELQSHRDLHSFPTRRSSDLFSRRTFVRHLYWLWSFS